jgi:uncharacterized cupin superfamily protein
VADGTIEICENIPELTEPLEEVKTVLNPFKEGMRKANVYSTERNLKDKVRDNFTSAFMQCAKGEKDFPYENDEVISAVEGLAAVLEKYSAKVTKLPLDEETAALDNMLAEVDKLNLTALEGRDILRWPAIIKEANEEFKSVSGNFIEDNVQANEILAASKIAPQLRSEIEKLYVKLFSLINIHANEEHIKAYAQLQEIVKSFS